MFAEGGAGGDKGLLRLGPGSMLARVVASIRPQVSALALNANGDPARFATLGLPVIADTVEGFVGPLAGVLAGMRWAADLSPAPRYVVSAPSDAPFLSLDLVARLVTAADANPGAIALARSGSELHPVAGCWPVRHADHLEAALRAGLRKVLRWTDQHGTLPVDFDFLDVAGEAIDPFFNANTPADLDEARRLLARMQP